MRYERRATRMHYDFPGRMLHMASFARTGFDAIRSSRRGACRRTSITGTAYV
jgi:hypothetical protein